MSAIIVPVNEGFDFRSQLLGCIEKNLVCVNYLGVGGSSPQHMRFGEPLLSKASHGFLFLSPLPAPVLAVTGEELSSSALLLCPKPALLLGNHPGSLFKAVI